MIKFYDTNSLLLLDNQIFNEPFAISSVTLMELENIKVSNSKDEETKYKARKLLHMLDDNQDKYDIHIFDTTMLQPIIDRNLEISNDTKILATAIDYDNRIHPDETIFVTNDLALKIIANLFFGNDSITSIQEEKDTYAGYMVRYLNDLELSELYSHLDRNIYDVLENEYLIIENKDKEVVDTLKWHNGRFCSLKYYVFDSKYFGPIKPMKDDVYQKLAFDSLMNNQITMLRGPAGSGKTLISLSFLMQQLETGKIDKIIIFCNTVATMNSAKLGLTA